MEVVDDMKLGKWVKRGGFRSGAAFSGPLEPVRWHSGLRNLIRSVTKNLFAGCGYRLSWASGGITAAFLISILPFLGAVSRLWLGAGAGRSRRGFSSPLFLLAGSTGAGTPGSYFHSSLGGRTAGG